LKSHIAIGRSLVAAAILLTLAVTLVVDWKVGHMTDASWPAHAHYHLLLYHGTMIMFCAVALWCLWGPRRDEWFALRGAVFIVLAFWVPFYPAALFPTASIYATRELAEGGVPANLIIGGVMILLSLGGYYLAHPRDTAGK